MFTIHIAVILYLFLTNLSLVVSTTTGSYEDSLETTTGGSILIRRRLPSKQSSSGGGRLSLINNRFSRRPRPRKKNLDREQLLEILGNYYDPDFMSIEEPLALANHDPDRGASYVVNHDNWQHADLIKRLQSTNLSLELAQLGGQRIMEDPHYVKAVEKWLLKRASCPVRYAWEDIGNLFWPRYIKRGECASVPGTCSWPPGMHCVAAGTSTLHVLRWQCKVPRGHKSRRKLRLFKDPKRDYPKRIIEGEQPANLKCSWVRVPYPIVSDCLCTC